METVVAYFGGTDSKDDSHTALVSDTPYPLCNGSS